jgi:DNA-directed RNA polymerase specialized sigma24 family protein
MFMHASELAQLAALVAHHTPTIVRGSQPIREKGLEQYWTASKCRLDRWLRALKAHQRSLKDATEQQRGEHWRFLRPMLDEILLSETLTRVWAAIGSAIDGRQGKSAVEPIARSTLIGHLEARNRALQLIVFGHGLGAEDAVELNRLRRRVERWTDLMLGYVLLEHPVNEFAFDRSRADEFAEDLRHERKVGTDSRAWQLVHSSLQVAFEKESRQVAASAELNQQIAAAVMGCLGEDLFDSLGLLKSRWQIRLTQVANDAQGMLTELLSTEPLYSDSPHVTDRQLPRWQPRSPRF